MLAVSIAKRSSQVFSHSSWGTSCSLLPRWLFLLAFCLLDLVLSGLSGVSIVVFSAFRLFGIPFMIG